MILRCIAILFCVLLPLCGNAAEEFPQHPIKLVVPYPPGGAPDLLARLLAESISSTLGQAIVVDNRPGAASLIATHAVARAAPDGYTLLLTGSAFTVNPAIRQNVQYEPIRDFTPIYLLARVGFVLVVPESSRINSFSDLIALSRFGNNALTYGSSGVGTSQHLAAVMLEKQADVRFLHVPYAGASAALNDLYAGRLDFMFGTEAAMAGGLKARRLRAIAVSSKDRLPSMPNVPTISEAGVSGFAAGEWFGLLAPKSVDSAITTKLAAAVSRCFQSETFKAKLRELGLADGALPPDDFAELLRTDPMAASARASKIQLSE